MYELTNTTFYNKYKYIVKGKLIMFYSGVFVLIFWQPFIWKHIKPSDGTIDQTKGWFLNHAVSCLNNVRSNDSWVMMRIGRLLIRDPHASISYSFFKWNCNHIFVWRRSIK